MCNKPYVLNALGHPDSIHRADIRLSDISNLLGADWVPLAFELGISTSDVNLIKTEYPNSINQQAMVMLRLWLQSSGNKATGKALSLSSLPIGVSVFFDYKITKLLLLCTFPILCVFFMWLLHLILGLPVLYLDSCVWSFPSVLVKEENKLDYIEGMRIVIDMGIITKVHIQLLMTSQ